jgi:hypothetical protein
MKVLFTGGKFMYAYARKFSHKKTDVGEFNETETSNVARALQEPAVFRDHRC